MPEGKRILDIGIGKGGHYIQCDPPGTIRFGLDVDEADLQECRERYGVTVFGIGEAVMQRYGLPFADRTFHKVELLFPFGRPLYCLAEPKTHFWFELGRVLHPNGQVIVTTEVPTRKIQTVVIDGEPLELYDPAESMVSAAKAAGFDARIGYMTPKALRNIGTIHALKGAEWLERGARHIVSPRVARITACKKPIV